MVRAPMAARSAHLLLLLAVVILLIVPPHVEAKEGGPSKYEKDVKLVKAYLIRYGYLSGKAQATRINDVDFETSNALKEFQRFYKMKETGEVNEETLKMVGKKRCGDKDKHSTGDSDSGAKRFRRYATSGTKWNKMTLTYRIVTTTKDLPEQTVRKELKDALKQWEQAVPLKFKEATGNEFADVDIVFGEDKAYPNWHLGPALAQHTNAFGTGVIAHAYFPVRTDARTYPDRKAGDVHFNDAINFIKADCSGDDGNKNSVSLSWVALHEFGHSLGLDHSAVQDSIMYAAYDRCISNVKLNSDDIAGAQRIYGRVAASTASTTKFTGSTTTPDPNATTTPTTPTPSTTTPPPRTLPPGTPTVCEGKYDAALKYYDNITLPYRTKQNISLMIIKGDYVWSVENTRNGQTPRVRDGYPRRIASIWPGMTGPIDAATHYKLRQSCECVRRESRGGWWSRWWWGQGRCLERKCTFFFETLFFKGSQVWKYAMNSSSAAGAYLKAGYPKSIQDEYKEYQLPSMYNSNLEAVVLDRYRDLVFIKDGKFWKESWGYYCTSWNVPAPRELFPGTTIGTIDAAVGWNNRSLTLYQGDKVIVYGEKSLDSWKWMCRERGGWGGGGRWKRHGGWKKKWGGWRPWGSGMCENGNFKPSSDTKNNTLFQTYCNSMVENLQNPIPLTSLARDAFGGLQGQLKDVLQNGFDDIQVVNKTEKEEYYRFVFQSIREDHSAASNIGSSLLPLVAVAFFMLIG